MTFDCAAENLPRGSTYMVCRSAVGTVGSLARYSSNVSPGSLWLTSQSAGCGFPMGLKKGATLSIAIRICGLDASGFGAICVFATVFGATVQAVRSAAQISATQKLIVRDRVDIG